MTLTPELIVIVAFGLLFVITAALAQGLSSTRQSLAQSLDRRTRTLEGFDDGQRRHQVRL